MRNLEGRVALVTGAGGGSSGGIGAAIARCLAGRGARIAVNDLSEDAAAATVECVRSMGSEATAVVGDVGDAVQAESVVRAAVEQFGQLDILVNNAGISGSRLPVERTSDESWLRVVQVNLNGPFFTSRAAVRFMRPRRFGRIVNIASIAATRVSFFAGAAYTATKAGLLGFTRHLATEVTQYGITVNALLPGMTETPLMRSHATRDSLDWLAQAIPAGRTANPEEIGYAVAFLASDEAAYISGTALPIDGSLSALPGDFGSYRLNCQKSLG